MQQPAGGVTPEYNLKATVVFLLTVGNEQGLYGSKAFANYSSAQKRIMRLVINNKLNRP